ncbi:hypothetical protein Hdeb2414_s0013g00407421 [Helianthus debilis subsp. tardiflorus]
MIIKAPGVIAHEIKFCSSSSSPSIRFTQLGFVLIVRGIDCVMDLRVLRFTQGLSVGGYFHANEQFDDFKLSTVARNFADHVY